MKNPTDFNEAHDNLGQIMDSLRSVYPKAAEFIDFDMKGVLFFLENKVVIENQERARLRRETLKSLTDEQIKVLGLSR